jgi:hypothetical protein
LGALTLKESIFHPSFLFDPWSNLFYVFLPQKRMMIMMMMIIMELRVSSS